MRSRDNIMALKQQNTCCFPGTCLWFTSLLSGLLMDIVTLWLSMRGHSMAAARLKEYKEAKEVR